MQMISVAQPMNVHGLTTTLSSLEGTCWIGPNC
jgi:hypothetical protein